MLENENRLAIISIIVQNRKNSSDKVNSLLCEYGQYILGRMGIPYKQKGIAVLSVVLDAPQCEINSLTGKLGMIEDVTAKTLFSKF